MLTNNTHSMPKNKKLHHEEAAGSPRNLNDFNDAILKHILSFLPTKFAARTSVLSKRWEFMWTSLPTLDFDECTPNFRFGSSYMKVEERERFMNFVERALILHKSCIRKFSLRCQVKDDFSLIKRWISAISNNVQEFEFELLRGNDQLAFPLSLFNCATMEVLKLHEHYSGIQLPSKISLPCLKILTLHSLLIKYCHQINRLFAGPALEQLFIYYCKWIGEYNNIIISAPKLWTLSIYEHTEGPGGSATISAPQLQTFVYQGSFFNEYRFPHPPSITDASLEFRPRKDTSLINKVHFDKVLIALQSVENLTLSPAFALALSHSTVPKFRKLINLKVYGFCDYTELPCKDLERLASKCPCLESLKLLQANYKFNDVSNLKFQYLPSTLKEFVIRDFGGEIEDIYFIRILLSKLTSLETMKIVFRGYSKVAKREEIKSILSALHRGSKSCKLIIG